RALARLRPCRERPRSCCAAKRNNKFSPSDVDCHATPPAGGRVHANRGGRYHALAKERTMFLRCESLSRPCLSRVKLCRLEISAARLLYPGGFNWSAQHLLISLDE